MFDTFEGNMEGCYLYSRHSSPVIYILTNFSCYGRTETANVAASGMGCHNTTLLQLCGTGDHIVSNHYDMVELAFLKKFYSRLGIQTTL
jgi:methionine-gamma-lyase